MVKQLLIDVQARLAEESIGLQCVAEDWGQLDFYVDAPPVSFPCALIDYEATDYSDLKESEQLAESTVAIRVADYRLTTANAIFTDNTEAFSIFDLIQRIYLALQGKGGDGYGRLTRISCRRIPREDSIREFKMIFSVGFKDYDAAPVRRFVETTPGVDIK